MTECIFLYNGTKIDSKPLLNQQNKPLKQSFTLSKKTNSTSIWQISALHLNKITLLSGVILEDVRYRANKKGSFRNLKNVIRLYFANTFTNKNITIELDNESINTTTDKNGSFQVIINSLYDGDIKIFASGAKQPLSILQNYPITFKNTSSTVDVISDIDDTILVSHTANFLKRVGTIAFKSSHKRQAIPFSQKLLVELEKLDSRIFYVSKSESNLFDVLTNFIEHKKLPKGKLFLTPYLSFKQLLASKGVDFKLDNIRFLIENTYPKCYVLLGDDSQRDMEVYHEIVKAFPKRIIKIYIRKTKPNSLLHKKIIKDNLNASGVPIRYFLPNDHLDLSDELNQIKL